MRIAVISDIHGNLPALESVVEDAGRHGVDLILGAGDWIGYGPFPAGVLDFLACSPISCISGNYDIKAIRALRDPAVFAAGMKPFKWKILEWTCRCITPRHVAWIEALPDIFDLEPVPGQRLIVCHGTPDDKDGRIYPDISWGRMLQITHDEPPRILVAGHTHMPFVKPLHDSLVVNAGSAGQPVDGNPKPSYCLLDLEAGKAPAARIIRFDYPIDRTLNALAKTDLPDGLLQDFARGLKRK